MSTEKKIWLLIFFFASLFSYAVYNVYRPDEGPMSFVRGQARELGPDIIVGPYPTEDEMLRLKKRGVVEVISLMDNDSAVESDLVSREKKAVTGMGMRFANFPMDFSKLDSDDAKGHLSDAIAHVLGIKGTKVYVHCYLGRHRVGMFESEFLRAAGGRTDVQGSSGGG